MININLLDWRDQHRLTQNIKFYSWLVLVVSICLLIVLVMYLCSQHMLNSSSHNIQLLNQEINNLDPKIAHVLGLEQQKNLLLARRKVIEPLQANRALAIKIFNLLSTIIPPGVVLDEFSRKAETLELSGIAASNADIATVMQHMQNLPLVKSVTLSEIIAVEQLSEASSKIKFKLQAII